MQWRPVHLALCIWIRASRQQHLYKLRVSMCRIVDGPTAGSVGCVHVRSSGDEQACDVSALTVLQDSVL